MPWATQDGLQGAGRSRGLPSWLLCLACRAPLSAKHAPLLRRRADEQRLWSDSVGSMGCGSRLRWPSSACHLAVGAQANAAYIPGPSCLQQFMFQRQQEMEGGYLQHQQAAAAAAAGVLSSSSYGEAALPVRPRPRLACCSAQPSWPGMRCPPRWHSVTAGGQGPCLPARALCVVLWGGLCGPFLAGTNSNISSYVPCHALPACLAAHPGLAHVCALPPCLRTHAAAHTPAAPPGSRPVVQSGPTPCGTASCCAPAARASCCRRTRTCLQTPSPPASQPPSRCAPRVAQCPERSAPPCSPDCLRCLPQRAGQRLRSRCGQGAPQLPVAPAPCRTPPGSSVAGCLPLRRWPSTVRPSLTPACSPCSRPALGTQVALRWFCSRSLLRHEGITKELIDRIPGKQTDRKTPLGELNWVSAGAWDLRAPWLT